MLAEIEEANFDIVIIDNFFLHRNFYLMPAKLGNRSRNVFTKSGVNRIRIL